MIHMAMLLEREENDKEKEIVDGYLWVTENEKTMLYALREREKVSVHHSEAKND